MIIILSGNPLGLAEGTIEDIDDPNWIIDVCVREGVIWMEKIKVFLCHTSGDKEVVREVYQRLRDSNTEPWLDEVNLIPGQNWRLEIPKVVKESHAIIVFLSKRSVTKEGYVQKEMRVALDAADEKPEGAIFVIPVRLDDCQVPSSLADFHWVDYFEVNSYEKIMRALTARAEQLGLDLPTLSYG